MASDANTNVWLIPVEVALFLILIALITLAVLLLWRHLRSKRQSRDQEMQRFQQRGSLSPAVDLEAQRRAEEEAARKAEEERKAREDAEVALKWQQEEQHRQREETERRQREEAERRAKEEDDEAARKAAEDAERQAAEERRRAAAEEARREAEADEARKVAKAERRAARKAAEIELVERERKHAEEEEEQRRRAAEEASEIARRRAVVEEEERVRREASERLAREEVERRAREEAERRAKEEADQRAREEAERRAKEEADRHVTVDEFAAKRGALKGKRPQGVVGADGNIHEGTLRKLAGNVTMAEAAMTLVRFKTLDGGSGRLTFEQLDQLLQELLKEKMAPDIIRRFARMQFNVAGGHKTGDLDFDAFLTIYSFIKEQVPKGKQSAVDDTLTNLKGT